MHHELTNFEIVSTKFDFLIFLITLVGFAPQFLEVNAQQEWYRWKRQLPPNEWNPWESPMERFDKYTFSKKMNAYGEYVKGFSVPMLRDTNWNPFWDEYPQWMVRRINCFLGVPYAEPPIGRHRFRKTIPPRWNGTWNATYFRPACPQKLEILQEDIPTMQKVNISEDCLYMNIFVPNRIQPNLKFDQHIYPVLVYIHSGNFSTGTAQSQPGHVLATRDVVVVTFNYRLGALGFLSTEDEHAPGNWGMWDQIQALEFIKRNIIAFRGDPNRITIMGEGAGGVSVGLHLVSPVSRDKGFYKQAILMSGTELSMNGVAKSFYRPRQYATQLAKLLNCPTEDSYGMLLCLRDNSTLTWEDIVRAQSQIKANDGIFSPIWVPVQDGIFYSFPSQGFLPESPDDLRRDGNFARVPTIVGINANDGAPIANWSVNGLSGGISESDFGGILDELMKTWRIVDACQERAREAIKLQYTHWRPVSVLEFDRLTSSFLTGINDQRSSMSSPVHELSRYLGQASDWPDPDNATARGLEYINMITDVNYGVGMDKFVKQQSVSSPTYMYVFNGNSRNDRVPSYLGLSHSAAVPYVLGFPFLNETTLNETNLVPRQKFDNDDRRISDSMMDLWSCFVTYGNPTPNETWNVVWQPFDPYNLTYLEIGLYARLGFRYRRPQYDFWNELFPKLAKQDYFEQPTSIEPGHDETTTVITLAVLLGLSGVIIASLLVLLVLMKFRSWKSFDVLSSSSTAYILEKADEDPNVTTITACDTDCETTKDNSGNDAIAGVLPT